MDNNIFEKEFRTIGTDIYLQIVADASESERVAADFLAVEKIYEEKRKLLSRFDNTSEISKLNDKLGEFSAASPDILHMAEKSLEYYTKSDGLFDPRILNELERIGYQGDFQAGGFTKANNHPPTNFKKDLREDLQIVGKQVKFLVRMDFTGIAKGFITDKVVEFLIAQGWQNFLVDSGGDMFAKGQNKEGEKWGIALEGSKNENEIAMEISNEGLATSGNTRKYWKIEGQKVHHLINPREINSFNFDLQSVTVTALTTEEADALAKILFLLGVKKGAEFASSHAVKAIFLQSDQSLVKINI